MHLARPGDERAVGRDTDRGVVAPLTVVGLTVVRPTVVGMFVERRVHEQVVSGGKLVREGVRATTGKLLRFDACAPRAGGCASGCGREVRRQRELLEAYEPGTVVGGARHSFAERSFMSARIVAPALLHECHTKWLPPGRVDPRRGFEQLEGGPDDHGPAGTGWVMQCTPPPPYARARASTPTTSRPG